MKRLICAAAIAAILLAGQSFSNAQSQSSETFEEKKSYSYAEWARGRFSDVVTVQNPGKIIYLGGVGSEDETSAQGGAIRHVGDYGALRYCQHSL